MKELYIADVSGISCDAVYPLVSKQRREKADKLRFAEDKRLSLCAGLLLEFALKKHGEQNGEIIFSKTEKPYLKSGRLFFNLSHSGEYVICAVSDKEVGCDIEKIRDIEMKIAEKYFSEGENEALAAQKDEEKRKRLLFGFWTRKESYLKATGEGISALTAPEKSGYSFFTPEAPEGYALSVCVKDKTAEFEIIKVEKFYE